MTQPNGPAAGTNIGGDHALPVVDGSALQRAAASLAATDLAFGDIDVLFHAVQARLAHTVSDAFSAQCDARREDMVLRIRTSVLECVAALNQVHGTMTYEVGRRRMLEQTILNLQDALAGSQAELSGTQADEREARRLALHDSLTLLPNADFFRDRLDRALAQAERRPRPIAVLFLDLDDFKAVNDTHGHDVGDTLLRIVAVRLAGAVRAEDLVSRVGGDEFACLIVGAPDQAQLGHLVCKLFDAISGPLQIGTLNLSIRASIGVAMRPAHGTTSQALLRSADAAMYRAKREQSGYAFFDERVDARTRDSTLSDAAARDQLIHDRDHRQHQQNVQQTASGE